MMPGKFKNIKEKDVIELTRKLVSFNTVNPPGNEAEIAHFAGDLLNENGFKIKLIPFEDNRLHLIAEKGCVNDNPPVVFSGHFDTVPLGAKKWIFNPYNGKVVDGRLYGRGSSDMKGGLAAMMIAAILAFKNDNQESGVRLIFTSGEELGCQGAEDLIKTYGNIGTARGIIIGEPTNNNPVVGHKGGLYLKVSASGKTAHSSMPHLGENAIYKVVRAITKIEKFSFGVELDDLLGIPSINVGKISGGLNINSVPDYAEFTIDARTTTKLIHADLIERIKCLLGNDLTIETLVDLPAVSTDENNAFVKMVYSVCGISSSVKHFPRSLPYLTDGSVLQPAYGNVPTVIIGPGQPEMAHQTDEFCSTANLERAVKIYMKIILNNNQDGISG